MSFSETVFLFFLALIVFGPKKLPEIARTVGRYLNEFKRASNEFKAQIEQEINQLEHTKKQEIIPPTSAPEGTASRNTYAASELPAQLTESSTIENQPAEGHLTEAQAASGDVATLAAAESAPATTAATESVSASDSVPTPKSQESHA